MLKREDHPRNRSRTFVKILSAVNRSRISVTETTKGEGSVGLFARNVRTTLL